MVLNLKESSKTIIGMVHLPPLPGSPGWQPGFKLSQLEKFVKRDIIQLINGGVHGLLFENFGDIPFKKDNLPPITISSITRVVLSNLDEVTVPFGINALRNDWKTALAIAGVTGADFVRVNILSGVYATDQGLIEGDGYHCLRYKKYLEVELGRRLQIFADVDTKHGTPLHNQTIEEATKDLIERTLVDGIILTGRRTGDPVELKELKSANKVAGETPIIIGSGINDKNIKEYQKYADGFIVGSYFKRDGKIANPIDINRVKNLVKML